MSCLDHSFVCVLQKYSILPHKSQGGGKNIWPKTIKSLRTGKKHFSNHTTTSGWNNSSLSLKRSGILTRLHSTRDETHTCAPTWMTTEATALTFFGKMKNWRSSKLWGEWSERKNQNGHPKCLQGKFLRRSFTKGILMTKKIAFPTNKSSLETWVLAGETRSCSRIYFLWHVEDASKMTFGDQRNASKRDFTALTRVASTPAGGKDVEKPVELQLFCPKYDSFGKQRVPKCGYELFCTICTVCVSE